MSNLKLEFKFQIRHYCGNGNDFLNVPSISSECGEIERCHFIWTKYDGGTCYLKKGNIRKEDAVSINDYNMVCGVKPVI